MSAQLDLFKSEDQTIYEIVLNLKSQLDSMRKKLFAEIGELRKENEFLSLQLQLMMEEEGYEKITTP